MSKVGYIYILASRKNGTTYVGVTSDLVKRIWEHRDGVVESFTSEHNVHNLVHFEQFDSIIDAIAREKQLKNWKREWKVELIVSQNPEWDDLYKSIL